MTLRIAITPGEPAGIGPDLLITLAQQAWDAQLVVLADAKLLKERAKLLGLPINLIEFDESAPAKATPAGSVYIYQVNLGDDVELGVLNDANGQYVLDTLRIASEKNMDGTFDAVVTGPVHKGIINKAGISFSGHTEYFAQQLGMNEHYKSISRGVIDTRDVIYFLSVTFFFLFITKQQLKNE